MAELSQATKTAVALAIEEAKLIKFGTFTLKSGIESPFYIDLRKAQSHPATFRTIVDAYGEMIADTDSLVAGLPEAATPLAGAVGYSFERSLVQPRKVVKEHGTKSAVEGDFEEGDKVTALDDLITKGDSKLEAIKQLEGAGLVIDRFIVLIDREQGGLRTVRDAGYDIQAGMTITELLEILKEHDKLSSDDFDTIIEFIREN